MKGKRQKINHYSLITFFDVQSYNFFLKDKIVFFSLSFKNICTFAKKYIKEVDRFLIYNKQNVLFLKH